MRFALVLRHDVEGDTGLARCGSIIDMEAQFGLHSAFFFVPEGYCVDRDLRSRITSAGGEVGIHGLKHDGMLYSSRSAFRTQALRINRYLRDWDAVGFSSPSSHHRLDWMHELEIDYDTSTFDEDPFEPQPDGLGTIFPHIVRSACSERPIVELPYTLPQDFTLFVILRERTIRLWKEKLEWIVQHRGMVFLNTHPDYMRVQGDRARPFTYSAELYHEFLSYISEKHRDSFWSALPREVAGFWRALPSNSGQSSVW